MVVTRVMKKTGDIVTFDKNEITDAIFEAVKTVGGDNRERADKLADKVVEIINKKYTDDVPLKTSDIDDIAEYVLIKGGHDRTAKAYILRRKQKEDEIKNKVLINTNVLVESYLHQMDWRVKENSNMGYSLQGLNYFVSGDIISRYWLEKIYPKEIRSTHQNGDFHIHDLTMLSAYCCGWDIKDVLLCGFSGVGWKTESKPPNHFRTALGQLVNFLYTLQGETAGAEAISSFDTYLAPFIRYDGLIQKEVKQALQEFIFNMNIPTRVGFQSPFTNVTLDLIPPDHIKDENIIIGGKLRKERYCDFQKEMDMFNRAFAEVLAEGDARGRVFTFPIPTYNLYRGFDWNTEVIDYVMEITAKYGIPYFANFVNSDMKPEDARSMCCRLRLDNRELRKKGGGLFGANPQTGSLGVVTLNMARIGYLAKDESDFLARLDKLLDLAKESLEIKRKVVEKFTAGGLYPYSRFYLRGIHAAFGEYWKNHFNTIGVNGMNEALLNLMNINIGSKEGIRFSLKTLDFIKNKLSEYQEATDHMYNLEATPGEGITYRFANIDKKKYPDIIVANNEANKNGAAPYYTNSTHLPVNFTDDIFEALELQDELQTKYTGGTVLHGFIGERMPSAEATKKLVKKIAEHFRLPYYTITPTFSICPAHNYISGEQFKCPQCGAETEVYSRVVGYLRPVQQWNDSKRAEFGNRKTYDKALKYA